VSRPARLTLFLASGGGIAALLLWAVAGLPDFGHYHGAYGTILKSAAPAERDVTNVVAAVVFDYRGFDTLGEEFILFGSVMGVALLLREVRDPGRRRDEVRSDAVRLLGVGFVGGLLVLGLYVVAHGYLTPGGGFQGGVVLACAFALLYLAGEYRAYRRLTPAPLVDVAEGVGAGGYVTIGIVSLLLGSAYLHNFGPLGTTGTLASGGSIPFLNAASALEVGAAFVLLFTEFLEELEAGKTEAGG
jgi:multicomponent Na+:H+ antiporter subunit B